MLSSTGELCFMITLLSLSVIIFSSACYIAEHGMEHTQFTSIPSSVWWSCITLTTVGYGDVIPESIVGKSKINN